MALNFFDTNREEVENRFIDLADGRTLFLPRGRGGPVFLVPDEATRLRLWRAFGWLHRGTHVVAAIAAIAALKFGHVAVAIAILPTVWLLGRAVEQATVMGLPQVHDPVALAAAAADADPTPLGALMFTVAGVVLCGGAAWTFGAYPDHRDVAGALALFGVMLLLGGVRALRQLQETPALPRPHPLDNKPTVPR